MAYEDILSRYANLYKSQAQALKDKTSQQILGYNNQKNELENQYTDLANTLKNKIGSTKEQYSNLYKGLDLQNAQAKEQNYIDRNNVDVGVNQNLNRIQELMAKNGWLGGGENLQAQLNANSDRMNGFGNADKTMGNTMNTILNNRDKYQADEQSAYNDLNGQIDSANREKVQKMQAIIDAINLANTNQAADELALKANLDAQAQAEIYNANQAALSRQNSRSSSSATSAAKSEQEGILNQTWAKFQSEFNDGNAENWLKDNANELIQWVGASEYNKMVDRANKYKDQLQLNKRTYNYRIGGGGRQLMPT